MCFVTLQCFLCCCSVSTFCVSGKGPLLSLSVTNICDGMADWRSSPYGSPKLWSVGLCSLFLASTEAPWEDVSLQYNTASLRTHGSLFKMKDRLELVLYCPSWVSL